MLTHTFLQSSHATCGRVVFNVLLAYVFQDARYLSYQSKLPLSSSFWDMVDKANEVGISLTPVRMYHYPTFLKLNKPFIALLHPASPHYVLVRPKRRFLYVFDPGYGERKLSREMFWSSFTQYALLVGEVSKQPRIRLSAPFSLPTPWFAFLFGAMTVIFAWLFWWIPPFKGHVIFLVLMAIPQVFFFLFQARQFSLDQRRWFHQYQKAIVNRAQFERWLHLAKLATLRPLRHYVFVLTATLIVLYLSSISFYLVAIYGWLVFVFQAMDPSVQEQFNERKRKLEKQEKSLDFPLKSEAFVRLQRQSMNVMLLESLYVVSLFGIILLSLAFYGWLFPYSHFSHFISGISVFLSLFGWLQYRRIQKHEKSQFYSLLDTFLNCE
jgi:hypothetical protein